LIIGGIASYYLTKFMNKFFLPIMAGLCGAMASFMLVAPMGLNKYINYALVTVVAGIAVYLSDKI